MNGSQLKQFLKDEPCIKEIYELPSSVVIERFVGSKVTVTWKDADLYLVETYVKGRHKIFNVSGSDLKYGIASLG